MSADFTKLRESWCPGLENDR